jgi:hypothetical protein
MIPDSVVSVGPWTQFALGVALKQHYRVGMCPVCGGPDVFSKEKPFSRCLRCWSRRDYMAVKQHKDSWRRCALCDKPDMAGVPVNRRYCGACQALTPHERAKRLRWKAERELAIDQVPPKTSINTAPAADAPPETNIVIENPENSDSEPPEGTP